MSNIIKFTDPTVTKLRALKMPEAFSQKHQDFLDIYSFCKMKYVRNVLRHSSKFKNSRLIRTQFDYEYANENDCVNTLLTMQAEMRRHLRILTISYDSNIESYIKFVNDSLTDIVTDIVNPISDILPEIHAIIDKYRPVRLSHRIDWARFAEVMSS